MANKRKQTCDGPDTSPSVIAWQHDPRNRNDASTELEQWVERDNAERAAKRKESRARSAAKVKARRDQERVVLQHEITRYEARCQGFSTYIGDASSDGRPCHAGRKMWVRVSGHPPIIVHKNTQLVPEPDSSLEFYAEMVVMSSGPELFRPVLRVQGCVTTDEHRKAVPIGRHLKWKFIDEQTSEKFGPDTDEESARVVSNQPIVTTWAPPFFDGYHTTYTPSIPAYAEGRAPLCMLQRSHPSVQCTNWHGRLSTQPSVLDDHWLVERLGVEGYFIDWLWRVTPLPTVTSRHEARLPILLQLVWLPQVLWPIVHVYALLNDEDNQDDIVANDRCYCAELDPALEPARIKARAQQAEYQRRQRELEKQREEQNQNNWANKRRALIECGRYQRSLFLMDFNTLSKTDVMAVGDTTAVASPAAVSASATSTVAGISYENTFMARQMAKWNDETSVFLGIQVSTSIVPSLARIGYIASMTVRTRCVDSGVALPDRCVSALVGQRPHELSVLVPAALLSGDTPNYIMTIDVRIARHSTAPLFLTRELALIPFSRHKNALVVVHTRAPVPAVAASSSIATKPVARYSLDDILSSMSC